MKLSPDTLKVLRNFQDINDCLLINPGNVLKTMKIGASVMAEANLDEEFPHEIAIWDLGRLNQLLAMFPDADVDFNERKLTIAAPSGGVTTYHYTQKALLESKLAVPVRGKLLWPYEIRATLPHETLKFQMEWPLFQTAMKVANTLDLSSISFSSNSEKGLFLRVVNPKSDTSNLFEQWICEAPKGIKVNLKKDNLKFLDRDYIITIAMMTTDGGFVTFESTDAKIKYWVNSAV